VHPGGTITYRDFAINPIPHFYAATGLARVVPPEQRSPAQRASFALSIELINDIKQADTVLLGLPLYNYGPPSTIEACVDHLIAPGVSIDAQTNVGLLGDTEFIVLAAGGGGYGPGTPREGWDHAEPWLPHAFVSDRAHTAVHHRRIDDGAQQPGDGRPHTTCRREPGTRGSRHR
jgi:FMN-dependent NADH-azoreductase